MQAFACNNRDASSSPAFKDFKDRINCKGKWNRR
jgi:hypothetical protein